MEENKYIQDKSGIVYKVMPNHFLKISPWEHGEDRRVKEIVDNDYRVITYKNACIIVNNQFDDKVETWNKYGKKYLANSIGQNKNYIEHTYMLSTLPNHKVFLKDANSIMKYTDNMSITSSDSSQELKLIRHKGKIYYILIINEFLPRVKAYNLMGEFCQWIGIDHCKPIFNVTDKKYI